MFLSPCLDWLEGGIMKAGKFGEGGWACRGRVEGITFKRFDVYCVLCAHVFRFVSDQAIRQTATAT